MNSTNEYRLDYKEYILGEEWNKKRKLAFKLFKRECQRCGATRQLHVHHKTYERFKDENVETDLSILCKKCHKLYHSLFSIVTIGTTDMFIKKILKEDRVKSGIRNKKAKRKISSMEKQYLTKIPRKGVARSKLHNPVTTEYVDLLEYETVG